MKRGRAGTMTHLRTGNVPQETNMRRSRMERLRLGLHRQVIAIVGFAQKGADGIALALGDSQNAPHLAFDDELAFVFDTAGVAFITLVSDAGDQTLARAQAARNLNALLSKFGDFVEDAPHGRQTGAFARPRRCSNQCREKSRVVHFVGKQEIAIPAK